MNRSFSLIIGLSLCYFGSSLGMEKKTVAVPNEHSCLIKTFLNLFNPEEDQAKESIDKSSGRHITFDATTAVEQLVNKKSIKSMQRSRHWNDLVKQETKREDDTETKSPIHQQLLKVIGTFSIDPGTHYKSFKSVYDGSKTLEDTIKPDCNLKINNLKTYITTHEEKKEGIDRKLQEAFLIVSKLAAERKEYEDSLQNFENELSETVKDLEHANNLQKAEKREAERIIKRLKKEISKCELEVKNLTSKRTEQFENAAAGEQTWEQLHELVAKYDTNIKELKTTIEIYQEQLAEMECKLPKIHEASSYSVTNGYISRWKSREIPSTK